MGESAGRYGRRVSMWLVILLTGCLSLTAGAQQPVFPLTFRIQPQLPRDAFASSLTEVCIVLGDEQMHFIKEDDVHWRNWDSTLDLPFAWRTSQPGAVTAVYQVSTLPFPEDSDHIMNPPGLVVSGFAGAPPPTGEWRYFTIDFRTFAPVPPGETRPSSGSNVVTAPAVPSTIRAPAVKAPASALVAPNVFTSASTPSTYLTIVEYYIRVVTLSALAKPVGIPSPAVKITYGELPDENQTFAYQGQTTLNHPTVRVTGYVPIQTEDPEAMYYYIVTQDIYAPGFDTLYHRGDPINFKPKAEDAGFWESLWNSIGEVYSDVTGFFKSAVNWCATAYEDIKGYAIDAAVVVAGEDARGLLTTGLEIGLAAMGIPPSIPNYDELTSLGKDYLVEAAADYTGLPPEATAAAVDAFLEEASRQASGGENPNVWIKPDPSKTYRPAYLTVFAQNASGQTSDPIFAQFQVQIPALAHANLFHSAYAYIPALAPGETISLPVYLEEDYAMHDPDNPFGGESYYAGMQRFWNAYNTQSARIRVSTTGSSQSVNPTQVQQELVLYDCRDSQSF